MTSQRDAGAATGGKDSKTTVPKPKAFKYPSEDEYLVRRLGSAVLNLWSTLSPELKERLRLEAAEVWDREFGVVQLQQKLDAFIRRHPSRIA